MHGAGLEEKCWVSGNSRESWEKHGFTYEGTLKIADLREGDVLIKDGKHSRIYIGNKLAVGAEREGWDSESIRIVDLTEKK